MQSLPQKTEQEKGGEGFTVVWVWIINEAAFPNIMKTKQKNPPKNRKDHISEWIQKGRMAFVS